jgi:hypothetical protein
MSKEYASFFKAANTWITRPVHFSSEETVLAGVLERVRMETAISDHKGKSRKARLAVFTVKVPGPEPQKHEHDPRIWNLMCDFDQDGSRLEKTNRGNIIFKSGSISGVILLTDTEERFPDQAEPQPTKG